jgi:hypothetical protein
MIEMLKAYMKRNYYVHLHIKRKSILW